MKSQQLDLTARDLVAGCHDYGHSPTLANEQEQEILEFTAQFR